MFLWSMFFCQDCLAPKPNFDLTKKRKGHLTRLFKKIEVFLNCVACVQSDSSNFSILKSENTLLDGNLYRADSSFLIDKNRNQRSRNFDDLAFNNLLPWLIFNGLSPKKPDRCDEVLDQKKTVSSISRVESGGSVEVVLPRTDYDYKCKDCSDLIFERMAMEGQQPKPVPVVEMVYVQLPISMFTFKPKNNKKTFVDKISAGLNETKAKLRRCFEF